MRLISKEIIRLHSKYTAKIIFFEGFIHYNQADMRKLAMKFCFLSTLTLQVPSTYEKSGKLLTKRFCKVTVRICRMCNILYIRAVINAGWQIRLISTYIITYTANADQLGMCNIIHLALEGLTLE